jgi:hypothetical protein
MLGQGIQNLLHVLIFEIIGECWESDFNSRTMLTRKLHTIPLTFESTLEAVTQIRYPVPRTMYLEKILCETNQNLVYSWKISYLYSFLPKTVWILILKLISINTQTGPLCHVRVTYICAWALTNIVLNLVHVHLWRYSFRLLGQAVHLVQKSMWRPVETPGYL